MILAILHEQDVSERYYLESQIAQAEKLTALGQLAVGLAHEINNPLTVILANAQILQRELPAGDARLESVELIGMAGARAARLVRNLLDFSRMEASQHQLVDINDSLRFALTLIQHELAERSINLLFVPEDHLPSILANLESLEGVWLNLFLNAIDSIDKIPGALQVSTHHLDDELHIVVKDNGRGIPQDNLGRVFEPFYTTKPAGKGTGLGLSVCRQVIEQYQGSIQVRSQVGKGSEFEVILPINSLL